MLKSRHFRLCGNDGNRMFQTAQTNFAKIQPIDIQQLLCKSQRHNKDSVLNCQCHYIKQQATVTPNPVFLRGFALCILKFYDTVLYRFLSYSVPFFSIWKAITANFRIIATIMTLNGFFFSFRRLMKSGKAFIR